MERMALEVVVVVDVALWGHSCLYMQDNCTRDVL